jgi:tetratricopeptide (TPR) repeat protein
MQRFRAALRTFLENDQTSARERVLRGLLALALLSNAACLGRLDPPPPRTAEQFTAGRELSDLDELARLRAAAEREPMRLEAQWQAGMAHVRATLHGHVDERDHAERYLERAWRLDPEAKQVPAARVLARFLNMRSAVLDLAKLDLQIELYQSLLDASSSADLEAKRFRFASFAAAAEALERYGEGDTSAALRKLTALERAMHVRTREQPEDIDASAMAGNFELTFAGMIPVGVDKRLRRGVAYLETQQDHWQQLSPPARNTGVAPNVRSVFALYLAEALLAAGEVESAARRYQQILNFRDQPETVPREQILAVARHRLANLDAYAGSLELLPPWPAGITGCVACHSHEASLPIDDLYLSPGLELIGVER